MDERLTTTNECLFIANRFGNQFYANINLFSFVLDIQLKLRYSKIDCMNYLQGDTIALGKFLMDSKLTVGEMKKLLTWYQTDLLNEFKTLCEVTEENKNEPEVEYQCLCPRVNHREDLQIEICGKKCCFGISIFRYRFLRKISVLKALKCQDLPDIWVYIGCDLALRSTAEECEKEGYRISFRKYQPVLMKFRCECCNREETNIITAEGEILCEVTEENK